MCEKICMSDENGNIVFTTNELAKRFSISYGNVYMKYKYHGDCHGYKPVKIGNTLYWKETGGNRMDK